MTVASSPEDSWAREEWEVTGDSGDGFGPQCWVFGNPHFGVGVSLDPESEARKMIAALDLRDVRIRHRTVTATPWEQAAL